MSIQKISGMIVLVIVLGTLNAYSGNYEMRKQNEAFYGCLYYWLREDMPRYILMRSDCERYGMLLFQEHMNADEQWLTHHIWFIKKGQWLEKRNAKHEYIPCNTATIYFAILLEEQGIDVFREPEIIDKPLIYVLPKRTNDQ